MLGSILGDRDPKEPLSKDQVLKICRYLLHSGEAGVLDGLEHFEWLVFTSAASNMRFGTNDDNSVVARIEGPAYWQNPRESVAIAQLWKQQGVPVVEYLPMNSAPDSPMVMYVDGVVPILFSKYISIPKGADENLDYEQAGRTVGKVHSVTPIPDMRAFDPLAWPRAALLKSGLIGRLPISPEERQQLRTMLAAAEKISQKHFGPKATARCAPNDLTTAHGEINPRNFRNAVLLDPFSAGVTSKAAAEAYDAVRILHGETHFTGREGTLDLFDKGHYETSRRRIDSDLMHELEPVAAAVAIAIQFVYGHFDEERLAEGRYRLLKPNLHDKWVSHLDVDQGKDRRETARDQTGSAAGAPAASVKPNPPTRRPR